MHLQLQELGSISVASNVRVHVDLAKAIKETLENSVGAGKLKDKYKDKFKRHSGADIQV